MGISKTNKNWEGLAKRDPLWAICTNPEKKRHKWSAEEFFKTGEDEIAFIFEYLQKKDIRLDDYQCSLDFGCGVGRLSRALAARFKHVIAVDASETMIRKAQNINMAYSDTLEFVFNDKDKLSFLNEGVFSFIYSSIVLQHIPAFQQLIYIEEFIRVMKPGALAVFQTITKDIRKLSTVQKIKNKLKIRERMALLGIGKGYQMAMHVLEEQDLEILLFRHGSIESAFISNHAFPDFNGKIRIIRSEECLGYISKLFIFRKNK
jgi:SAM-dependent methyltransferase